MSLVECQRGRFAGGGEGVVVGGVVGCKVVLMNYHVMVKVKPHQGRDLFNVNE